jgi:hypothetical protein
MGEAVGWLNRRPFTRASILSDLILYIQDGWESQPTSKIDFSGLQPDAILVRIGTPTLELQV